MFVELNFVALTFSDVKEDMLIWRGVGVLAVGRSPSQILYTHAHAHAPTSTHAPAPRHTRTHLLWLVMSGCVSGCVWMGVCGGCVSLSVCFQAQVSAHFISSSTRSEEVYLDELFLHANFSPSWEGAALWPSGQVRALCTES